MNPQNTMIVKDCTEAIKARTIWAKQANKTITAEVSTDNSDNQIVFRVNVAMLRRQEDGQAN